MYVFKEYILQVILNKIDALILHWNQNMTIDYCHFICAFFPSNCHKMRQFNRRNNASISLEIACDVCHEFFVTDVICFFHEINCPLCGGNKEHKSKFGTAKRDCAICIGVFVFRWKFDLSYIVDAPGMQAKLYIPSSVKTQRNLVPFCLWADCAVRAVHTENFCKFAKVS